MDGMEPACGSSLLDQLKQQGLYPVALSARLVKHFYEGYANQTLWPLFHPFPSRLVFDPAGWEAYVEANKRFLDAIVSEARPGDLIWVHDYQLMLLPQMIRKALPDARIGFFLHIPFPSSSVFRVLPRREELLQGVLGADFVAFQTHTHLQHFRSSLLRILGLESRMDQLELEGRPVRLEALPIGVAANVFTRDLLNHATIRRHLEHLRERFRNQRVLLAVDRLDYTKGIPERLRSFRCLLAANPGFRGRIVLVQIAVPSRERVPSYQQLRREVNELVGSINGEYGTTQWTPVVFMQRSVSRPELAALYSYADIAWVTPLRDGMNLVAKEYVCCQHDGSGALILSEFAGAAAEMGEALLVNPYDEERTAACVAAALRMPINERRRRMRALHDRVSRNNSAVWADRFIQGLKRASEERIKYTAGRTAPDAEGMKNAFRSATVRRLVIDYDALLVGDTDYGTQPAPPSELLSCLEDLATSPDTYIALISSRSSADLAEQFADETPLWLVAEQGAMQRRPGSRTWKCFNTSCSTDWKKRVKEFLEAFVDRTPGSFIEEKEHALVWHCRTFEPEFGDWLANELVAMLEQLLAETELRAIRGQNYVEVRPVWASKKNAVRSLLTAWPATGFCLTLIGDDDEDVFEVLPEQAITVRVGLGFSRARFQVAGPLHAIAFLSKITSGEHRFQETES